MRQLSHVGWAFCNKNCTCTSKLNKSSTIFIATNVKLRSILTYTHTHFLCLSLFLSWVISLINLRSSMESHFTGLPLMAACISDFSFPLKSCNAKISPVYTLFCVFYNSVTLLLFQTSLECLVYLEWWPQV